MNMTDKLAEALRGLLRDAVATEAGPVETHPANAVLAEYDALRVRGIGTELIRAARDVCSARDPEWADANVSLETAVDTLAEALAEYDSTSKR